MASYNCTAAMLRGCRANIHYGRWMWQKENGQQRKHFGGCIQLYPCGWRSCAHTLLPHINIGVISPTWWPVIAGQWKVVHFSLWLERDWEGPSLTHSIVNVPFGSKLLTWHISCTMNGKCWSRALACQPPNHQRYITTLFYYCLPFG